MKYLSFGFLLLLLTSCTGSNVDESSERMQQSYLTTIEDAAKEITDTKEFGDCVEPTVKMCITQVANELARKSNSLSLCEKLQNEDEINSCKYGVIISKLSVDNTMSTCDVLSEKYKSECRITSITLSASEENVPGTCDQIFDEFPENQSENAEMRVDQCKFPIIMKKTDLSSSDCNELSGKAQKDTCLSMLKSRSNQR